MRRTYCDGCGTEIHGYHDKGIYHVEISERPPGNRKVSLDACSQYCLRDAVNKATADAMTPTGGGGDAHP